MSDSKSSGKSGRRGPETVFVEVVVSHDELRKGERGEVELTDRMRALLDAGYLRLADPSGGEVPMGPVASLGAGAAGQGPQPALLGVVGPQAGTDATGPVVIERH